MTRVVMVPGLRGDAPDHWQQRLTEPLGALHLPTGRTPLDLDGRVADLAAAVEESDGPVVLVAHSAGVLTLLHWAAGAPAAATARVEHALLVTPPTLSAELPPVYPRLAELHDAGWLPVPESPLPFATTVLASDDDALGPRDEVTALAQGWGADLARAGAVGHANPASGHGDWPLVEDLVRDLVGCGRVNSRTA